MDLLERLPDVHSSTPSGAGAASGAFFLFGVEFKRSNLDVGASAVFGFQNPSVSFSERSENPLIPPDPQILKPDVRRSSGLQQRPDHPRLGENIPRTPDKTCQPVGAWPGRGRGHHGGGASMGPGLVSAPTGRD